MTFTRTSTVTVDDITYLAELAVIEGTFLGWEDHGIFTGILVVTGGRIVGGRQLDTVDGDVRRATAYGMQWVCDVLTVLGARNWETITGKAVLLLSSPESDVIVGIAHPVDDRLMVFDAHAALAAAHE
jgi:hypothetical protein